MKLDKKAALLFLISFSLYITISVAAAYVMPVDSSLTLDLLLSAFAVSIPAFLLPAIVFRRKNEFAAFKAPPVTHILIAVALGIGCIFLNMALASLIEAVLFNVEVNSMALDTESSLEQSNIFIMFITVAVVPAISEEFLFRGALLESWRRNSAVSAAFISALLFALIHLAPSYLIVYFAMGMLFALVFLITRNVWMTVIIHFMNNLISVLQAAYSLNGVESETAAAVSEEVTQFAYIQSFIYLSMLAAGIIVPLMFVLRASCRRRGIGAFTPKAAPYQIYEAYVEPAQAAAVPAPDNGGYFAPAAPQYPQTQVPLQYPQTTININICEDRPQEAERSLFREPLIWVAIGLLIAFNIYSAIMEFGLIGG